MNRTRNRIQVAGTPHPRRHPLRDGAARITTFVPLVFKRRGLRRVVVSPDGVADRVTVTHDFASTPSCHDPTLLKALGRGYYWQHLIDSGAVADAAEIAVREELHKVTVNDAIRSHCWRQISSRRGSMAGCRDHSDSRSCTARRCRSIGHGSVGGRGRRANVCDCSVPGHATTMPHGSGFTPRTSAQLPPSGGHLQLAFASSSSSNRCSCSRLFCGRTLPLTKNSGVFATFRDFAS